MKWITLYAPSIMFGLFVLLSAVVAVTASPKLFIPVLAAFAAGAVVMLLWRFVK